MSIPVSEDPRRNVTEEDYKIYSSLYEKSGTITLINKRHDTERPLGAAMRARIGDEFLSGVKDRDKIISFINKEAGLTDSD
jgi:hypothetical protein